MMPIRTILFPTDFSDPSRAAFGFACSLARDYGAELVIAHVAGPPVLMSANGVLPPIPVESDSDRLREELLGLTPPDPRVRTRRELAEGDAVHEILRLAGEAKADLIVMGTHGRSGVGRVLMGSVAEAVLRKAPCPVLTVRGSIPAAVVGQLASV